MSAPTLQDWGLIALTILTLGSVLWALTSDAPPAPTRETALDPVTWSARLERSAAPGFTPLDEAIDRLDNPSRSWNLAVLGDSTGAGSRSWVHRVAESLAQRTGRPLEIHTWSVGSNAYESATVREGSGAPIVVWNGSASGQRAGYSSDHRAKLVPEQPDLLIINHGHNQYSSDEASAEVGALVRWAESAWDEPPALAITLQNGRTDDQTDKHAQVVGRLRNNWDEAENVGLIDVFSVFERADDLASLLHMDGIHPTDQGQTLWADTVWASLGFDRISG